jgi:cholesterol oxidase
MTDNQSDNSISRRTVVQGAVATAVAVGTGQAVLSTEAAAADGYDAIVIGTGFGGSIAALALHAQKKRVLLIERGTFFMTPEVLGSPPPQPAGMPTFPEWAAKEKMPVQLWARPDHGRGLIDLLRHVRDRNRNPDGLYQYSMFREADILTANGVGGGSLIYSNVNYQPKAEILKDLQLDGLDYAKARAFMEKYRGKINKIVTKIPLPPGTDVSNLSPADDYLYLDRARVLKSAAVEVAKKLGIEMPWAPLDLSLIEFDPTPGSDAAKAHTFCERQGRCILGCLPAARHTLNKTLFKFLLWNKDFGVTLSPQSEVRTIKRVADGYEVAFIDRRNPTNRNQIARAPSVFVAAGALGSTELLLRSKRDGGLNLSDALGTHFSTNGDFGGFAVDTQKTVSSARGPINTCGVEVNFEGMHLTIEDCAIPAMFAELARKAADDITSLFQLRKLWPPHLANITDAVLRKRRDENATEGEMVQNIFFFNVMGRDRANGRFTLAGDILDLSWPTPVADDPVFAKIEMVLKHLTEAMGGRYIPLPTWSGLLGRRKLVVTHPLGGCPIGSTMREGVVDGFGRVFDGSKKLTDPTATLPGLYVVDGSSIPGALAANPTLTIAAQAIKSVEQALGPLPL